MAGCRHDLLKDSSVRHGNSSSTRREPWLDGAENDLLPEKKQALNSMGGPPRARWKHSNAELQRSDMRQHGFKNRWERPSRDRIQPQEPRQQKNAPEVENRTSGASDYRNEYGYRGRDERIEGVHRTGEDSSRSIRNNGMRNNGSFHDRGHPQDLEQKWERGPGSERYAPEYHDRSGGHFRYRELSQDRRGSSRSRSSSSHRSASMRSRSRSSSVSNRPSSSSSDGRSASFGRDKAALASRHAYDDRARSRGRASCTRLSLPPNKRRFEQCSEPKHSSPPLKKRWVPPLPAAVLPPLPMVRGTFEQATNGNDKEGRKPQATAAVQKKGEDNNALGKGGNQLDAPVNGKGQHPTVGNNNGDSNKGNAEDHTGNGAEETCHVSEKNTISVETRETEEVSTMPLGEGDKLGNKKKQEDASSPEGTDERNSADGDENLGNVSKESLASSQVKKCVPSPCSADKKKTNVEATPDLTEASLDECHLKICSISLPAASDVARAMIVSESPHSVHPIMEVGGGEKEASKHVCLANGTASKDKAIEPGTMEPPDQEENVSKLDNDTDSSDDDTSSSEDEQEILRWAQKMFGVTPPGLKTAASVGGPPDNNVSSSSETTSESSSDEESDSLKHGAFDSSIWSDSEVSSLSDYGSTGKRVPPRFQKKAKATGRALKISLSKARKGAPKKRPKPAEGRRKGKPAAKRRKKKTTMRKKKDTEETKAAMEQKLEKERLAVEDAKRVKKEAKPPSAAELKAILAAENDVVAPSNYWVRRSVRQPSKSVLTAPKTRSLLEKLAVNDGDMVVLKMKKYLSDPDTPAVVIDAALDALEENSNCEALYIQNFNIGMRDEQVLHLLKVLQLPSCRIWCLNIGETYNVKPKTWRVFAQGLRKTKVTHMYASEHTISAEQKEQIRDTIRKNRQKHDMHINPDNLDVIIQCTHCWWNPANAKSLRPYIKKRGFEHILYDKEKQGLRGSSSDAPTGNCGAES